MPRPLFAYYNIHVVAMADDKDGDLEARLRRHSAFFTSMVKLIPAQCYHTSEEVDDEEEEPQSSKFFRNKRNRAPKQAIKEACKRAKRLKLDPSAQEQVQESGQKGEISRSTSEDDKERVGGSRVRPYFSVERVPSNSLAELRERLKNRIVELRSRRNAPPEKSSAETPADHTGHPQKQRRKEKKKALTRQTSVSQSVAKEPERPSIEDKGHLVFSKFDFVTPPVDRKPSSKKRDYKKLLAKAEARQKKIDEMTEQDLRKGQELQKQLKWKKAIDRAEGRKMKDNPALLQKTLKRIEKRKTKSSKEWEERKSRQQRQVDKRQEIRQQHIQERIEQKKAKAVGKKRRGRRGRNPGF